MTNTDIVREFYQAVAAKDADALEQLIGGHFDTGASVVFPESLPYGGTVAGAAKLARMFAGMAKAPEPAGPAGLDLTGLVGDGDQIAARVEFHWHAPGGASAPVPSSALELWTFADGKVREIRAYYWDTAALVAVPANRS